jgi:hypothetical protein
LPRSLPFHTLKPGAPPLFHNNDHCDEGKRIEPAYWCAGDGGRPQCKECARLNAAGN